MKSLSVKLAVILIGLIIFGCAEVWAEDWMFYGRNDKYLCFYDMESIRHPSKNIVEVSEKQEYTNKGINFIVGELGKKYENIDFTIALKEINCSDKTMRDLSLDDYSKEGKNIFSTSSEDEWDYIVQGSAAEVLYKAVCK